MGQGDYYGELIKAYDSNKNSPVYTVIEKDNQKGLKVSQINKDTSKILRGVRIDTLGRMSSRDGLEYIYS